VADSTLMLSGPQIVLDSLLTGWTAEGREFVAFPLTEVEDVASRERSTPRTLGLVGGATAVTAVVVALLSRGTGGENMNEGGEGPELGEN
jgi:hypothetical protein